MAVLAHSRGSSRVCLRAVPARSLRAFWHHARCLGYVYGPEPVLRLGIGLGFVLPRFGTGFCYVQLEVEVGPPLVAIQKRVQFVL